METNVIVALMPAFAAGFAVQRLLEIADPAVERFAKESKGYYLGMLSLIVGFGLAVLADLRVLKNLGAAVDGLKYLDFFVTGLIISAGTEGFNSILKFLSYKKEEKKAESAAESLDLRGDIERDALKTSNLRAADSFMTADVAGADSFNLTLSTPEDVLKKALTERVRRFKDDPTLTLNFDSGKFRQHMVNHDDARQVTVDATEAAATEFGRVLNRTGRQQIRGAIKVDDGYGAAIGVMRRALATGADPA
jgi:hypothetical protein